MGSPSLYELECQFNVFVFFRNINTLNTVLQISELHLFLKNSYCGLQKIHSLLNFEFLQNNRKIIGSKSSVEIMYWQSIEKFQ